MKISGTARRRAAGILMVGGALALGLLVGVGASNRSFTQLGITITVPGGWTIHDHIPPSTGLGSEIALFGSLPWGPCSDYDINCHYQQKLDPGQIEVGLGLGLAGGGDFCSFAESRPDLEPRNDGVRIAETRYLRIDGRPAIYTRYELDAPDYYLSDAWRIWQIATVDTTQEIYRIDAKWRGPGEDKMLGDLDRMIASIKLGPRSSATAPTASDCSGPFPPG